MTPYIEKYKRNIAIDMRTKGLSYSEIENKIHVPRSTLSYWLKSLKLTEEQKKKLDDIRIKALQAGAQKKITRTKDQIEKIRSSAAQNVKEISKRELWLMGVVLYWRERLLSGNENDLRKGVKFTSSDPYLVKLFLKWLQDIGRIKNEEIEFDIFIRGSEQDPIESIKKFWSEVTEFSVDCFTHVYYQKSKPKRKKGSRIISNKTKFGLLRTRVKASSMLARQISGWVRGIIKNYWD